jgi:hypothetical protein
VGHVNGTADTGIAPVHLTTFVDFAVTVVVDVIPALFTMTGIDVGIGVIAIGEGAEAIFILVFASAVSIGRQAGDFGIDADLTHVTFCCIGADLSAFSVGPDGHALEAVVARSGAQGQEGAGVAFAQDIGGEAIHLVGG